LRSLSSPFLGSIFQIVIDPALKSVLVVVMDECRPPLWSSGQSSWLLTQRSRVRSRRYHIFWVVVGLEQGPLSPCEDKWEATWKKTSGAVCGADHATPLYPQKLALNFVNKWQSISRYSSLAD
jgi:hypothetical protein